MFSISCEFLKDASVLDCPGGPASFNYEATLHYGMRVTSIDPIYDNNASEIESIGRLDIEASMTKIIAQKEKYPFITDIDAYKLNRQNSFNKFMSDFPVGFESKRYVAASLPNLSFINNTFDICLSGYLLFAYSSSHVGGIMSRNSSIDEERNQIFGLEWHKECVMELLRVTKKEIRFFPAHTFGDYNSGQPVIHPYAQQIADELSQITDGNEHALKYKCFFYQANYSGSSNSNEVGLCIEKVNA